MRFINTDGMAFIGPGSEWFWAMAQFVVVVITLAGIYRQLRAQGSANALQRSESLWRQWESDWLTFTRLTLGLAVKANEIDNHTMVKARPLLDFIATIDDLWNAGYIDIHEIYNGWGQSIQMWSAALTPLVERERVVHDNPLVYQMDNLVAALRKVEVELGVPPRKQDSDAVEKWLDFSIEWGSDQLRLKEQLKSGVIPTGPVSVAQS